MSNKQQKTQTLSERNILDLRQSKTSNVGKVNSMQNNATEAVKKPKNEKNLVIGDGEIPSRPLSNFNSFVDNYICVVSYLHSINCIGKLELLTVIAVLDLFYNRAIGEIDVISICRRINVTNIRYVQMSVLKLYNSKLLERKAKSKDYKSFYYYPSKDLIALFNK